VTDSLTTDAAQHAKLYRDALLDDVMPFWMRHSLDTEHGGYFTCLAQDGSVYDTDKFIWLQARQVWMLSALYNHVEQRSEWLDAARLGADFLRKHGADDTGRWYFSLTRDGRPLTQPYNIFSDCFAAMAFSEYARASDDDSAREIADVTYRAILKRQSDPKGPWEKSYPGTRPMRALGVPMILANLTLELDWMLPGDVAARTATDCVDAVFGTFLDQSTGLLRENVSPEGHSIDSLDGRLVNPGHGIEAMWFMMDVGARTNDTALIDRATQVMLQTLEFGWDSKYGGVFYFLDSAGHPPDKLEWDQKLWWVHLETLVALVKGFRLSRDETLRTECSKWYDIVHKYTWERFPDPEHAEWYGYLNRQGEPFLPLKGGKWKGCFHVPRGLWLCWNEFDKLSRGSK
jgi:N-acylglucosamine 2-epimerase